MGNDIGDIVIETIDNERGFVAGEVVKGFVHVKQKQHFPAKNLSIGIFGEEIYSTLKWSNRTETKEIINTSYQIASWVDGQN